MEDRDLSSSTETKAPSETMSEDWSGLPWQKLEQHVYRLQKRIYRASACGNQVVVHRLQQLLMRSRSAQLLAVRRVSQDNQGKKTAGMDGVKSLTPPERLTLAEAIHPRHQKKRKAKPLRRVWIPKPGKSEKRPLGIPMIRSYCLSLQAILGMSPGAAWQGGAFLHPAATLPQTAISVPGAAVSSGVERACARSR
jgi:hypothetical protein